MELATRESCHACTSFSINLPRLHIVALWHIDRPIVRRHPMKISANCPGNEIRKTCIQGARADVGHWDCECDKGNNHRPHDKAGDDAGGHLNVRLAAVRCLPRGVLLPKILDRHLCLASVAEIGRPSGVAVRTSSMWANVVGFNDCH